MKSLAATIAVTLLTAGAFAGAGFDWTGASGNLWTNAANWELVSGEDEDGVPDADDDVWFQATGSFAGGVMLDGDRECNSVNINNNVAFTIGTTNDTLTISTGAVNSVNVGDSSEQVIACNLKLVSPDGMNTWTCYRSSPAWNAPSNQLRIDGKIIAAGVWRLFSDNSNRHGKITIFDRGHEIGGLFLDGGTLEVNGCAFTDIFGGIMPIAFGNAGALLTRAAEQTIPNPFDLTMSKGTVSFFPYTGALTLASDIVVPKNVELVFGNTGSSLIKLDPEMTITGDGKMQIMRTGVAFTSPNQFSNGNFFIGNASGIVIFDGITWNDFTSHYTGGYGSGDRQWRFDEGASNSSGFAAHGAPILIDTEDVPSWFDHNFQLGPIGANTDDATIRAYCDAPVNVACDTVLTGRRVFYSSYSADAPGLVGTNQTDRLNTFYGNISGPGAIRFEGRAQGNTGNDEFVFAGTNNCWTGSQYLPDHYGVSGNSSVNTGPGGIGTHQRSTSVMMIQFASPEALPTGNGGASAWLAATSRYAGDQGYVMRALRGGAVYNLADGYRYLMGSNKGSTIGTLGATGEAGTSATLAGDMVCLHAAQDNQAVQFRFLARGPIECFAGAEGAPLALAPTYGFENGNVDNGLDGAATVVSPSTEGPISIFKRGDGTLVLDNIAYTTLDGEGDTSERFTWFIGESNMGDNAEPKRYVIGRNWRQFAGAVRETGTNKWNSTAAFPVYFCGGVIELDGADFRRNISATPAAGEISLRWGGGFAAHGSDAAVELNDGGTYIYNDQAGFNRADFGLIFGSRTADATVNFENPIDLWNRTPYIMTVRGVGNKPEARLNGQITRGGFVLTNCSSYKNEPIPAGALELAHPNNTFDKKVDIEAGTLLVSGAISNGTENVTVKNGGALGGTGIVKRPVVVEAGGALAPGNLGAGALTISGNLTMAEGAVYEYEEGDGARDLVKLEGGTLTLPAAGTVRLAQKVYGNRTLVTGAGSVTGAGAADLSGWTVEGVDNADVCHVELRDGDLVLCGVPPGTVLFVK